jgi:hypothetical protein
MQPESQRPTWYVCILAFLLGVGWFVAHGGWGTLDSREVGWLRSEDLSQHLLGWLYFRQAAWAWPLGHIGDLGYPVGTTVGFMDSNPWLSMLLRPISAHLPLYFQFQGPWLALSFGLLAVSGAFVASLYTPVASLQLVLGALVATAPPALLRVCHTNLAAQWVLVVGLYGCLRSIPPSSEPLDTFAQERRSEALGWALTGACLVVAVIGVHCYLAAMVLPLLVFAIGRRVMLDGSLSVFEGLSIVAGYAVLAVGVLVLFGFIGSGIDQHEPGFGSQAADLLALINPVGWSRFLPSFRHTADEFEGFCYLGLGNLVLIVVGGVLAWRNRARDSDTKVWGALFVVGAFYALYALSDIVWLDGQPLLSLRAYDVKLLPIFSIFRASGRFLWVTHYLLVLWAGTWVVRALTRDKALVALLACLVVQLADVTPPPQDVRIKLTRRESSPLTSVAWELMGGDYRHLALYPAFFPSNRKECGDHYPWGHHVPYSFLAYERAMTFNSNYAGRADAARIGTYCRSYRQAIAREEFDGETVYVVASEAESLFRHKRGLVCRHVDGALMCVRRDRETLLTHWLGDKR